MSQGITRRDYLNGVAFFLAGAATIGCSQSAPTSQAGESSTALPPDYYPPTRTGLRGSHEGSFEVAHNLAWKGEKPLEYADTDEAYDMVVVGAGISGTAAAYLYRQQAGRDKRILLLDNHDDFGGHAKRNEFHSNGQMLLGAGGSANFENPASYSDETKGLLKDLGFDLEIIKQATAPDYFSSTQGIYSVDPQSGAGSIVNGAYLSAWFGIGDYQALVNALPLPESEKEKVIGLIDGSRPLQKELPKDDISKALGSISYKTFLTDYVGLEEATCALWHPIMSLTYLVGIDCLSLRQGIKSGLPGLSVLSEEAIDAIGLDPKAFDYDIIWMPDGNASLMRQMVRRMIPNAAPGATLEDLLDAPFDYSQLDHADNVVRLRLNSTVVNVVNNADETVSISYVQNGKAYRVKSERCILACYNALIPHICPEISEKQKENLRYAVKGPMLAVNVLVRDGRSFYAAGSEMYQCPTSPYTVVTKAPPTSLGNYTTSSNPEDPMVIYMLGAPAATPNDGSLTARDLYRMGRRELYTKPFEDYEREIRDQLTGMFGPTGFDADRDIEAITLNRWSHGYAYTHFELFDPDWPEGQAPHVLGRKSFGRISIANSDSEALASVNGAVNAAWRAVQDQIS